MPYIIDGHNLIPKIPGLSLQAIDDEMQLVQLLQEFCRLQGKEIEVFFDQAALGQAQIRKYGRVTARFVRQGGSADQAIRFRVEKLAGAARSWTVVSSDQSVQEAARRLGARVLSSEAFASLIQRTLQGAGQTSDKRADTHLKPEEVDAWLKLFGGGSAPKK